MIMTIIIITVIKQTFVTHAIGNQTESEAAAVARCAALEGMDGL